ncbi:transcriptional regulator GutM [Enterococcus sp. LJL99]
MHPYIIIALVIVGAYILQIVFSLKQIRHFNESYSRLRRQGKVAIGKRPGKIRAGTISMFALDEQGTILDALTMQGVTVAAKFKAKKQYVGTNITDLTQKHPLVTKENKLVSASMLNAKEIYIKVMNQDYTEESSLSPFTMLKMETTYYAQKMKSKLLKSE